MRGSIAATAVVPLVCIVCGCVTDMDRQVARVVESEMSAREKGLQLAHILRPGISRHTVRQALGEPDILAMYAVGWEDWTYFDYQLDLVFDSDDRLISAEPLRVGDESDVGPTTQPGDP